MTNDAFEAWMDAYNQKKQRDAARDRRRDRWFNFWITVVGGLTVLLIARFVFGIG